MAAAGDVIRYVATKVIRTVVQGREGDVLDALGIAWRNRRGQHIQCPYPDHADADPSWRWDEARARALCTCIEKSDSIFDVVAKIKSLDFEAAKIRVAELLGRTDLVKLKGDGSGQKTDPAALLAPPADLRDDTLPRRYLAGRLGLADPDFIPPPATATAGWKALPYFDPPTRKGAKPHLVASPPCAVFKTIAVDGRHHAHRIYLSRDGAGKAELGTLANGKARDPKKSARRPDGAPSSSGCCVVWGDVQTATHTILTEGIENAAAVAYAFTTEISEKSIAVVSAITAGGVEAFMPWPAATRITVAGDRDEVKPGAGFKRGERAARTLALRLLHVGQRTLDLRLALPGAAGTSTDFVDLLHSDGVDAVRAAILAAAALAPTAAEIEDFENRKAGKGEIEITRQRAPLPPSFVWPMEYQMVALTSEIWAHKLVKAKAAAGEDAAEERWVPICTPFSVIAVLQMADAEEAYGLRLMLRDLVGEMRAVDIDRSQLSRLGGAEVKARLLGAGMRFANGGENTVVEILKEVRPPATIIVVAHTGWHRHSSELRFIRPDGNVGDTVELLHDARLSAGVVKTGTFAGWQAAVRAAVTADCPHWVLGAAAGFAGILVNLCALDTCGLSFSGPTSRGKTSAQQLAVSAWSSPKLTDGGLLKSLKTTENAIELLARTSTGTVLALDELAHVEGRIVGRLIYALAGNTGKNRMNAGGALRPLATWSTFVLLSGEKSLEQKVVGDDGQWSGGMAARFTDIDVTDVNVRVDDATLRAMRGIFTNYGHAGPRFVTALSEKEYHRDADLMRSRILAAATELASKDADAARIRAATPLAIVAVAGKLAQGFGILPDEANIAHAVKWAWASFGGSAEARALDPEQQMIGNLQRAIAERWEVSIRAVGNTRLSSRDAIAWYDDEVIYVPTTRICELAGGILKEQAIARLLNKGGHLVCKDDHRLTVHYVPKVGQVRCYALDRSVFGRPEAPPPTTSSRWERDDDR